MGVFLAVLADLDGLERALAGDENRAQRVAVAEQAFAGRQRPPLADDLVQPPQVGVADAGGQAQLLQRAVRAAAADLGEVEHVGHARMVPARA